jgi:hypothetical protein
MFRRILFAGLLTATLIFAQRGGGGGRGGGRGGDMSGGGFGGGVTSKLDRLAESLKLSKDQKKDVKTAFDEAQKEAAPLNDQMLKARQAIGDAVASAKSQDDIAKACSAEAQLEAQMTVLEVHAFAKAFETLDSDQKQRAGMLFQMMRGLFSNKNWNSD